MKQHERDVYFCHGNSSVEIYISIDIHLVEISSDWQKSAVMLSGNDAQAYMLTMSSGYTTKVKNVTRVCSCQSFCIILEFIQVVLVSELSIVASRSHLSIIAFPTVVRLWKGQRGGKLSFSTTMDARSTKQPNFLCCLAAWCRCSAMDAKPRTWNGEKGPCCREDLHTAYTVSSRSPQQTATWGTVGWSDPSSHESNLCRLLLNCAGTKSAQGAGIWESPFLYAFGLDTGSSMFFCSSSFPFASMSALCLCLDKMTADWEVMRLVG